MKIYKEESLSSFEFWSGAKDITENLTIEEFNQLESTLEELYPDGIDETQLNDLFWHDSETIADWIGTTEEEILNRNNEE